MKKKLLIALAVVLALPLLAIVAMFAIRETPDGPRVEAEPGVVGVEAGGAYAWIVRTPHGAVLVDAGLDAKGTAILAELASEGVQPDQVQAVLLTHGHPDHYAAAGMFQKAKVLVGLRRPRDDPWRQDPLRPLRQDDERPDPAAAGATGRSPSSRSGEPLEFDGAQFQVVATPGHSPGSVVYLYKDVLFTGDSLLRKKDGVAIAPSLFSEDSEMNRASLRAIEPLVFDKIADGHAGVTFDARRKLARFLAGS